MVYYIVYLCLYLTFAQQYGEDAVKEGGGGAASAGDIFDLFGMGGRSTRGKPQ